MATVLTVAIEKGGVGKTATAVNLAALMAMDGKKTLLVDMDAQANSTYMLTGEKKFSDALKDKGVFQMIRAHGIRPASDYAMPSQVPGLDLIPSTAQTSKAVSQMEILADSEQDIPSPNLVLALCLAELADAYDYIVIDTPPSRDLLTTGALVASDFVLVPCKCDDFCTDSLATTFEMCRKLSRDEETDIRIIGVVLTIVEKTALTQLIREELRGSDYKDSLMETEIRKGQAVSDSTRYASPVVISAKTSAPAKDYAALYRELVRRIAAQQD